MSRPLPNPAASPVRDRPLLSVSLGAIGANWLALRDTARHAQTAGVVKADGYGLGAEPAARKLLSLGCQTFFVATLDEGRALRPVVGGGARIFVLNGFPPGAASALADYDLIPVLNTLDEMREWAASDRRPAALHVDTGMNRAGFSTADLDALVGDNRLLASLDVALVMSHLANGDDPEHPQNAVQLDRFKAALARLPMAPASLAASGGIHISTDYHFDLTRPGIALYGGHPHAAGPNPMRTVISLTADIIGLRDIATGDTVGYGGTFAALRPTRLAVCNIGYNDGLLRSLANRGVAYIGDVACPYAGRVSMDLLTLDVTGVPRDQLFRGAAVEIIGPHVSIEEMAKRAGTANYEVLTSLGPRFARVYHDSHWTRIA